MLKFVHRVRFRFLKQVLFYYRSDESDKDHDSSGKSKDASSRPGPSQPFISTLDSPCEGPSTSFTEPLPKAISPGPSTSFTEPPPKALSPGPSTSFTEPLLDILSPSSPHPYAEPEPPLNTCSLLNQPLDMDLEEDIRLE